MARNTSRSSRRYLMSGALKDALLRPAPIPRSEYITVRDLAAELKVDPERLRPLIDLQYLRILHAGEYLVDCQVARPLPAAMDWLKQMMAPIHMRALLPVDVAAELLRCDSVDIRKFCLAWNIPMYFDPAFGELLSPTNFFRLFQKLFQVNSGEARYDRQMLLKILATGNEQRERTNPLPYSRMLEREIARISRLPEPDRTVRAVALYDAFVDAKTVKECISEYRQTVASPGLDKAEAKLAALVERCVGHGEANPEPGLSQPQKDDEEGIEATSGNPA